MRAISTPPRRLVRGKVPTVVLLLLLTLGPILPYLFDATSFAPGTLTACLMVSFLVPWGIRQLTFRWGSFEADLLAAALFLSVHIAVASIFVDVHAIRFAGSLMILAVILCTAKLIGPTLFETNSTAPVQKVFVTLLLCAAAAVIGLVPPSVASFAKPVFPFTEPSHFALAFLPLLLWQSVLTNGIRRYAVLLVGLSLFLLLQNLTLVVGMLVVILICVPLFRAAAFVGVVASAVLVSGQDFSYYAGRLDFSSETQNLSSLVYLQGWQMMGESLRNSNWWGLGFQQLGLNGTQVDAAEVINLLLGIDSNILDGGFLLNKIVSEFGIFGIVIIIWYCLTALKSWRILHAVALRGLKLPAGSIVAHSFVAMYLIEIFIRSAGYLVGGLVLVSAAILHLRNQPRVNLRGNGNNGRRHRLKTFMHRKAALALTVY